MTPVDLTGQAGTTRRLTGRPVLVCGGGSGIGAAIAARVTQEGGRAAILDLDGERAREVASLLEGAVAVEADVSNEESVAAAVAAACAELGDLRGVVNAAGYHSFAGLQDVTLDAWNRMLAVHATGTFLVCRATAPIMARAGGGSIVNFASIAAVIGRPKSAAYCAAKGAVVALSRQLAVDLAPDRIRVNAIIPGRILTPMSEPMYRELGDGDLEAGIAGATVDTPLGRVAAAEEVAACAGFLLSDDAAFVTGTQLTVDGGMTAI